jgi:hypothetical protein
MFSFNPDKRYASEVEQLKRLFANGEYEQCFSALKDFSRTHVGEPVMLMADKLIPYLRNNLKKKIVATFDPYRKPRVDELIICYGDYPMSFDCLICNNPVFRHLIYFGAIQHDAVEYDSIWNPVERIYIINLDEHINRYIETLRELKRMRAPFERITRFSACRDCSSNTPLLNGYIGCNRSHLAVIEDIVAQGYQHALILEDDFCFVDGREWNQDSLRLFFDRAYPYHICLLAASNDSGIEPYDDLLSRVYQKGTTTSGYMVSAEGARHLQNIWRDALVRLVTEGDTRYLADQSWAVLQPKGRFFVFKRKLGYQRPGVSCITGKMVFDLD